MTTPLLQDDGSGRIHAQIAELARWSPTQAGLVLTTFTPNPPWLLSAPWLVMGLVLLVVALPLNPEFFPVSAAIILVIFGGTSVAAWSWARMQKVRVAEHALLVGPRRRVIPFATIDPGRVAVSTRVRYLGRHFHSADTRILQSQGPTAVINGLNPNPARPGPHQPPSSVPSPFCEWGLSGDPREVLHALETAMIRDGFPAQGLADRARATIVTPPKAHPPQDLLMMRRALDPPLGAMRARPH